MREVTSTWCGRALCALLSGTAGLALGQVDKAYFDNGSTFIAPKYVQSIAATPAGYDLVGTGSSLVADGYPEVAVGSETDGFVRFYRNENLWDTNPAASFTQLFFNNNTVGDIDVFGDFAFITADDAVTTRLRDIELVDMTGDTTPDLLVAISYYAEVGGEDAEVGLVAHYKALDVGQSTFRYELFDYEVMELPVTSLATADLSQDGRIDIIVSCEDDETSTGVVDPARVFVLKNDLVGGNSGYLLRQSDEVLTNTAYPSYNVALGEFNLITTGSLGGTGNSLDFVTFGGNNASGLRLGTGTGSGPFSFSVTSVTGTNCGSGNVGLSYGLQPYGLDVEALILFDPFATADQSLATASDANTVQLLHNRPRFGTFYHLCYNGASADRIDVSPNIPFSSPCSGTSGLPTLPHFGAYAASGNLNGDPFGDLVHVDPNNRNAAFLLGRGTPDATNSIMQFDDTSCDYFRLGYAPYAGVAFDRVMCADLNLDGVDEVLITRHGDWTTNPTEQWRLVVYVNTTP